VAAENAPEAVNLGVAPAGIGVVAKFGDAPLQQTISVRSSSETEFGWSASENLPWLTLNQTSGQTPADLVATIDPSQLPVGTYTGKISFSSGQAGNSPFAITVTLQVTGHAIFVPLVRRT
jgi:hypothetical protein